MPIERTDEQPEFTVSHSFEKKLLLKKISEMTNIPTPSGHVMKVMLLLRDEEVKMDELIETIERDQSLVAQILKLINSGYYGLRKNIDTVDRAVNLLGILGIKQIVYSASIMDIFSDSEKAEWNHAYATSVLMGNILKENDIPAAQNLTLTMLMHDIGKVVLRRYSPKKYSLAAEFSHDENVPFFVAEEEVIHINHAEAASLFMEKWQMTEDIIKPILYHHLQTVPEDFILETALVQFVNWVDSKVRGILCYEPSADLFAAAGIEEIDSDYWINYHRSLVITLEGEEALPAPVDNAIPITDSFKHHSTAKIKRAVPAPPKSEEEMKTRKIERDDEAAIYQEPEEVPEAEEFETEKLTTPSAPEENIALTDQGTRVIKRPNFDDDVIVQESMVEDDTKLIKRPKRPSASNFPEPLPYAVPEPEEPPAPPKAEEAEPEPQEEEIIPPDQGYLEETTSTKKIRRPRRRNDIF